jgi:hypothetical protein
LVTRRTCQRSAPRAGADRMCGHRSRGACRTRRPGYAMLQRERNPHRPGLLDPNEGADHGAGQARHRRADAR